MAARARATFADMHTSPSPPQGRGRPRAEHQPPNDGRPYRFGFSAPLRMRLTQDCGIRKFRAIAAGFSPALKEARIRFAFASGMSCGVLLSLPSVAGCEDVPAV